PFAEGSTKPSDWKQHWAMSASLLATKGLGFREPWRYELSDLGLQVENAKPPLLNAPTWDNSFAQHFGTANPANLTALHISVAFGKGWTECNIDIDETGITMVDMLNNLSITPAVFNHSANELIFKTILGEHLPTWVIDRVNLHVLSPEMGYERIGIGFDVAKKSSVKVTFTASCSLMSCKDIEFSKVMKLDGNALKSLNPTLSVS